ncbi:MAG: M23 family metallopeptidase [Alphaproteobacteria bacterium]|nr:MAG: M23 family metallopeptidase [Alphaproteobacteria bacterium]
MGGVRGISPALSTLLLVAVLLAAPARAEAPRLALPVDCRLGETCFIQNYVDEDPGPGARDFACGGLTYDGHKGTDFALPTLADMARGVTVRAAAGGVVKAVRDGMPDTGLDGTAPEVLAGKDCGNGVVIAHGDGWETQYCHLKSGSITVGRGARVAAGTALGRVGLSGRTEFPHLHLSLRHNGQVIDPFAANGAETCGGGESLWQEPIGYAPGGIAAVGAAPGLPDFSAIKSGDAAHPALPASAPALVGWAHVWGARAGDRLQIELRTPSGAVFIARDLPLERSQARLFRAVGRKAGNAPWETGVWTISARLVRGGETVARRASRFEVTSR